jgi:DNA-binding TFAR19-related protein (PDSD5 family)
LGTSENHKGVWRLRLIHPTLAEAVNPVLAQLAKLDVEDISPKQALALIYEWKALLE